MLATDSTSIIKPSKSPAGWYFMPALWGAVELVAAGVIVVGESLAVLATAEFLEALDDDKVFGAAVAVLDAD